MPSALLGFLFFLSAVFVLLVWLVCRRFFDLWGIGLRFRPGFSAVTVLYCGPVLIRILYTLILNIKYRTFLFVKKEDTFLYHKLLIIIQVSWLRFVWAFPISGRYAVLKSKYDVFN